MRLYLYKTHISLKLIGWVLLRRATPPT